MRKTGQSDLPMEETVDPIPSKPSNIVRLDSYKEIPEPDMPLAAIGRKVYDEWCRNLLKYGLLTIQSREFVEQLAVSKDSIARAIEKGKEPPRSAVEAQRAALIRLEKLDANETLGKADGHDNVYAQFGFAKREKVKRFGR